MPLFSTGPENSRPNPSLEVDSLSGPHRNFLDTNLEVDKVLIEENPDAFGRDLIFAVTPLNNGRWILIFQQEVSDAFATWNTTKMIAIFLFLFWAAVVALFTYFMSRRMTLRIEEVIIQKDKMSDQVVEAGRLASIGELAAGIAHEINNPVAIMVEEAGWIQDLLAEDDPTTPDNLSEIERATAQIKTQGGRCKEITHKLLSFARKTDPTEKQLDLNEMIAGNDHPRRSESPLRQRPDRNAIGSRSAAILGIGLRNCSRSCSTCSTTASTR